MQVVRAPRQTPVREGPFAGVGQRRPGLGRRREALAGEVDREGRSCDFGALLEEHDASIVRTVDVPQRRQLRRMALLSKLQGDLLHFADDAFRDALRGAYLKKPWG